MLSENNKRKSDIANLQFPNPIHNSFHYSIYDWNYQIILSNLWLKLSNYQTGHTL